MAEKRKENKSIKLKIDGLTLVIIKKKGLVVLDEGTELPPHIHVEIDKLVESDEVKMDNSQSGILMKIQQCIGELQVLLNEYEKYQKSEENKK